MMKAAMLVMMLVLSGCLYPEVDTATLFNDDSSVQLVHTDAGADSCADAGVDAPVDVPPPVDSGMSAVDELDKACFPLELLEGSNVAAYHCNGVMWGCPEGAPKIKACGGDYPWMGADLDFYRPTCCP